MEAIETRARHARTDKVISDIVDNGIALQDRLSTVCALEYLKSHSIDADVIQRVLLFPARRRLVLAALMHKN
ncbi:hypothetical protein ACFFTM_12730 [Pseudoduganella plicata]|uniref:Uncharacterized protein n=1 Tax=Pseudoduganella plicata TaxID=321984 RepID=A0A4P7BE24_9BURK|nr:hypothetical protein [Pseudoduganella plicata]QBQ35735.1 hypothetical protein E1742_05845 [Pseudoduganella plicata]GGY95530.1 hypothetical protein GCM10007388_31120 [Pseudoduganella plicata]